jgi:hypothetical protein
MCLGFQPLVPINVSLPLQLQKKSSSLLILRMIKKPNFLNESSACNNKFRVFFKNPTPTTNSARINIGYNTCFRWEIRYGFIYIKRTLKDQIRSSTHSDESLTPSPTLANEHIQHVYLFRDKLQPFYLIWVIFILQSFLFHSLIKSELISLLCFLQYLCVLPCYTFKFTSLSI